MGHVYSPKGTSGSPTTTSGLCFIRTPLAVNATIRRLNQGFELREASLGRAPALELDALRRKLEISPVHFFVSRAQLESGKGAHGERALAYVDSQKLERAFAGSRRSTSGRTAPTRASVGELECERECPERPREQRESQREPGREPEREPERARERQSQRDRERQRETETERQRHRERQRQREREEERESGRARQTQTDPDR